MCSVILHAEHTNERAGNCSRETGGLADQLQHCSSRVANTIRYIVSDKDIEITPTLRAEARPIEKATKHSHPEGCRHCDGSTDLIWSLGSSPCHDGLYRITQTTVGPLRFVLVIFMSLPPSVGVASICVPFLGLN